MEDNEQLKISFGGCGFLGVYHAGVGKCVKDHSPHLFTKFDTFYGASAGAITAVCAACKSDPMVPYKWVKKTFEASRKYRFGMLHPSFDLYTRLRDFLEGFLPKNAHRLARGRVKISLTTFPEKKNWLVTDFNTRNELINVSLLNFASGTFPRYALCKQYMYHMILLLTILFSPVSFTGHHCKQLYPSVRRIQRPAKVSWQGMVLIFL